MPEGVKDLTKGKLESLLHIVDLVRGLDSRMEAQSLAVFLYVARRTSGNDFAITAAPGCPPCLPTHPPIHSPSPPSLTD